MKKLSLLLLASTLPTLVPLHAATPDSAQSPAMGYNSSATPDSCPPPIFPVSLKNSNVKQGSAQIAVCINSEGRITEMLPTRYTRREFATVTMAAMKNWRFHPATNNGKPITTRTEITIDFSYDDISVVSDFSSIVEHFLHGEKDAARVEYSTHSLKELDRIPVPRQAHSPLYKLDLAKTGIAGEVVIGFFIDENGSVRMPAIIRADYPELALLATDAIQQWQFEPPTCKGQPVLVRAQQTFRFVPGKSEAVPASQP